METLDFDHTLFTRQDAGDDSLFVVFYMGVIHDQAASDEQGRKICRDAECVRIMIPGDKNNIIDRPATDQDKRRFAKQYAAFKQTGKEDDQIIGTRLKDWPFLSRAQCEEFSYLGIKTVEQLAEVRDDIVSKVPGLQTIKRNAGIWLSKAKSTAESSKISARLDALEAENQTLKEVIRQAGEREDARLQAAAKA